MLPSPDATTAGGVGWGPSTSLSEDTSGELLPADGEDSASSSCLIWGQMVRKQAQAPLWLDELVN